MSIAEKASSAQPVIIWNLRLLISFIIEASVYSDIILYHSNADLSIENVTVSLACGNTVYKKYKNNTNVSNNSLVYYIW